MASPAAAALAENYICLIQGYFPAEQWANALCLLTNEIDESLQACPNIPPEQCAKDLGVASCYSDQTPIPATAYGLFGIVDVCWSPALAGNETPFTKDDWQHLTSNDPNWQVWAASVVYSIGGWRAWSTCSACLDCPGCLTLNPPCAAPCDNRSICEVYGLPIPYPRAPLVPPPGCGAPPGGTPGPTVPVAVAVAVPLVGLGLLALAEVAL